MFLKIKEDLDTYYPGSGFKVKPVPRIHQGFRFWPTFPDDTASCSIRRRARAAFGIPRLPWASPEGGAEKTQDGLPAAPLPLALPHAALLLPAASCLLGCSPSLRDQVSQNRRKFTLSLKGFVKLVLQERSAQDSSLHAL